MTRSRSSCRLLISRGETKQRRRNKEKEKEEKEITNLKRLTMFFSAKRENRIYKFMSCNYFFHMFKIMTRPSLLCISISEKDKIMLPLAFNG
jgi:hypothetical protein